MKKAVMGMMVAVFALAMGSTDVLAKGDKKASGEKGEKKESSAVVGTLAVVKSDKGEVTGATITTKSGTVYNVVMTGLSQDVVSMDGKEVHAKGEVKEVEGKMMLTIKGKIRVPGEKKEKGGGAFKNK